jgi:hypothetical protein
VHHDLVVIVPVFEPLFLLSDNLNTSDISPLVGFLPQSGDDYIDLVELVGVVGDHAVGYCLNAQLKFSDDPFSCVALTTLTTCLFLSLCERTQLLLDLTNPSLRGFNVGTDLVDCLLATLFRCHKRLKFLLGV